MRMFFIGLIMIIAVLSGCYGPKTEAQQAATERATTNAVEISGFAFNPTTITISKGTTVTWTQNDNVPHTITGSGFDSGRLNKGERFTYTFNEAGTFEYNCTIHPGMRGKVIVK